MKANAFVSVDVLVGSYRKQTSKKILFSIHADGVVFFFLLLLKHDRITVSSYWHMFAVLLLININLPKCKSSFYWGELK